MGMLLMLRIVAVAAEDAVAMVAAVAVSAADTAQANRRQVQPAADWANCVFAGTPAGGRLAWKGRRTSCTCPAERRPQGV